MEATVFLSTKLPLVCSLCRLLHGLLTFRPRKENSLLVAGFFHGVWWSSNVFCSYSWAFSPEKFKCGFILKLGVYFRPVVFCSRQQTACLGQVQGLDLLVCQWMPVRCLRKMGTTALNFFDPSLLCDTFELWNFALALLAGSSVSKYLFCSLECSLGCFNNNSPTGVVFQVGCWCGVFVVCMGLFDLLKSVDVFCVFFLGYGAAEVVEVTLHSSRCTTIRIC